MPHALLLTTLAAATGLVASLGTRALIPLLRRAAVLDQPNERSSHCVPTPLGGGIAVIAAILLAWLALVVAEPIGPRIIVVLCGALLLATVSWFDDLRGLSQASRLLAQFVAVGVWMVGVPPAGAVFQGWLPPALDRVAAALLWVWFINLFNFMDGIDGLAGSEAAAIGIGLVLFASVGVARDPDLAMLSVAVAAASLGFLVWNWAPARIFLGDVGSVPLGYLLGFLLLGTAASGAWKIALILPLYFLADATITLLRRLAGGERVWQAHRRHFYQCAVQRGLGHAAVVWRVIVADLMLIGLGWGSENGWGIPALVLAAAVVLALLASLAGGWRRAA